MMQDVAGLVGGGGVSIYYSHTLKMLFFSYAQGKSFLAPLNTVEDSVKGQLQWSQVTKSPNNITIFTGLKVSCHPAILNITPYKNDQNSVRYVYDIAIRN